MASSEPDAYEQMLKRQIQKAKGLTTEHLSCRRGALGHSWEPVRPDFDTKLKGAKAVAFQCQRCWAIKRGVVSKRYGEWLALPTIEYPEGYLIPKEPNQVGPTVSAQAVRAAFAARVQEDIESLSEIVVLHEPPEDE